MLNFIKKYKHLIFIFIFTFLIYELFGFYLVYGDTNSSFGFSYAIIRGEVPYRDFNIISTPLYAFVMSIGLKIFNNYLMFILQQSTLITIQFYFLYKMFGKKSFLIYLSMILLFLYSFLPTYNYLCIFMLTIILYLEKEHNGKDYLIGLFIGLAILSKHTVGVFFILPTLIIYYKDIKKILKRALGALLPGAIFIIYLLITNSFNNFVDLCVLGLFDFSSNNANVFRIWTFLVLVLFIVELIILFAHKKDIANYYLILTLLFSVPLYDIQHFSLCLNCFTIMILPYISFKDKYITKVVIPSIIGFSVGYFFMFAFCDNTIEIASQLKLYNYSIRYKDEYESLLIINKMISKDYKKYNNVIFHGGYYQMVLDEINDRNITYYDVLLYGNYGYNGSENIVKKLKKEHDCLFIYPSHVLKEELGQYDKKIIRYVRNNWKKLENTEYSKYKYDVYYKE